MNGEYQEFNKAVERIRIACGVSEKELRAIYPELELIRFGKIGIDAAKAGESLRLLLDNLNTLPGE